jgi:hypothetical protein
MRKNVVRITTGVFIFRLAYVCRIASSLVGYVPSGGSETAEEFSPARLLPSIQRDSKSCQPIMPGVFTDRSG